ncbi:MAG TPA: Anion transporter [Opitutae bacterium]|nr:Anion transporter [Opitutae bacterium]
MNDASHHSGISHLLVPRKAITIFMAFVLFFVIRTWLPVHDLPDAYNAQNVRTGLAILTMAAILWLTESLPLAITALLIPVVAALTNTLDVTQSFSSFAHPLIFLFLGGFGLAAALSHQQLDQWIALGILKMGHGSFIRTSISIFLVSAILSMWISNTATVALLLPVALGILKHVESKCDDAQKHRCAIFLLLGIAYSASIGGIGTLIGTPPNAIAAANLHISFAEWLMIGLPAVAILLPSLFVLLYLFASPGKIPQFTVQASTFKFHTTQYITLAIFLLTIVGWLFSAPLSTVFGIERSFDTIVAIIALLLLASCRLVDWNQIDRTTDWGVLLLFGGGITLSKILGSTGASWFLADRIQHLICHWPPVLFIATIVTFVIFLTELSSNTASTALLVPIFAAVAVDMGIPTKEIILPLTLAASCAFMLPIATPPNAIVFSSGQIKQRDMMRIGLVLNITFAVILTLLSQFLF